MREHEAYVALLLTSFDEALSPEEVRELRAHLQLCPECRVLYDALEADRAALSRLDSPSADFTARVMAAVAEQPQEIPFTNLPHNRPIRMAARAQMSEWWKPIRSLGAIAVCCVVVFATWKNVLMPYLAAGTRSTSAAVAETAAITGGNVSADLEHSEQTSVSAMSVDTTEEAADSSAFLLIGGVLYRTGGETTFPLPEGFASSGCLTAEETESDALFGTEYFRSSTDTTAVYTLQSDGSYLLWQAE